MISNTDDFDLDAALAALRMAPSSLARLCGVSRTTVWKWRRGRLPVPVYVRTLLRHQVSIRSLIDELAEQRG